MFFNIQNAWNEWLKYTWCEGRAAESYHIMERLLARMCRSLKRLDFGE
jgi:hypothetical protein